MTSSALAVRFSKPYSTEITVSHLNESRLIPVSHEQSVRETREYFLSMVKLNVFQNFSPTFLVNKLIKDESKEAVEAALKLLREYKQNSQTSYGYALSFVYNYLTKSDSLTEEDVKTLSSKEFVEVVSQLPSFDAVLQQFPDLQKMMNTKTLDIATKIFDGVNLIFASAAEKKLIDSGHFTDGVTGRFLQNGAIHLLPVEGPPVNPETHAMLAMRTTTMGLRSPYSGRPVTNIVTAHDIDISKQHFYCGTILEMVSLLEESAYDKFIQLAKEYMSIRKQSSDREDIEAIDMMQDLVKTMSSDVTTAPMLLSALKHLLALERQKGMLMMDNFQQVIKESSKLDQNAYMEVLQARFAAITQNSLPSVPSNKELPPAPTISSETLFATVMQQQLPLFLSQEEIKKKNWQHLLTQ